MRFSLFALLDQPPGKDPVRIFEESVEQAVAGEELGYHGFWLAEHHWTDYGICPSPPVLGAAIAARTQKIRIGVGVAILPYHDPRRLAEDYAMLDVLSNGRLDLGVGRGYAPLEFNGFGVPMDESRERFDEALAIMEGLWGNEDFTYKGKYHSVDGVTLYPRPVQDPIPVWLAAVSPDSFVKVGRSGRQFLSAPQITPIDKSRENYQTYLDEYRAAGHPERDLVLPMQRPVYAAATPEAAYKEPSESYMYYLAKNADQLKDAHKAGDSYRFYEHAERNIRRTEYDDVYEKGLLLFGDPERLIGQIEHLQEQLGLTDLICWMNIGGVQHDLVLKSMEIFANEVMPHFQD